MICVRDLRKRFLDYRRGWVDAVDGISFDCPEGEITGLLGPNGAGKTTTLRMLSTVLRPSSGSATIAGYDAAAQPDEVRARIGYMSASTQLYDRMTAWETVEFFGGLYDLRGDRLAERMEAVFDWLQMNDFREVLVAKMSTGMRQKVSIARTVVHDPPVLIFDEPTSNLDILVARTLLEKILELRDRGKTILFSTHAMSTVERICRNVVIIHRGRILARGIIPELLEEHRQPSVEDLLFSLIDRAEAEAQTQARKHA